MTRNRFFAFSAGSAASSLGRFFQFFGFGGFWKGASGGGFAGGLMAVLAIFCGGAWAQGTESDPLKITITGTTCPTNSSDYCTYSSSSSIFILGHTGSTHSYFIIESNGSIVSEKAIEIRQGKKVTLTIKNLNLKSAHNRAPILLLSGTDANSKTELNLIVEGENILTAGSSAPGIAVPVNATLTVSGSGKAAIMGGNRSNNATGSAAGIGGTGEAGDQTYGLKGSNNNALSKTPNYISCGTVILNGARLTIGADGSSGTDSYGGYGAGIGGGGGCTTSGNANGLLTCNTTGNSPAPAGGNGCTLTINGGTHIVSGADAGNAIGSGSNRGTTYPTGSATANGTIRINGGSLNTIGTSSASSGTANNANHITIKDGIRYQTYNYNNASNGGIRNENPIYGNSIVSKREFTVGNTNKGETSGIKVNSCNFGGSKLSCAVLTEYSSASYGINSVYTDYDSKVYFWLSTEILKDDDKIGLNLPDKCIDDQCKEYKANSSGSVSDNITFTGPRPSMIPPSAAPNTFVGVGGATGAYKTGFQMVGSQYVAAVGREITVYEGTYIQNDAGAKGQHSLKWYRGTTNDEKDITDDDEISSASGNLSSSATYTPGQDDYGKFIFARVCAGDNGGDNKITCEGGKGVFYPSIKVGVFVDVSHNDVFSTATPDDPTIAFTNAKVTVRLNNATIVTKKEDGTIINGGLLTDVKDENDNPLELDLSVGGISLNGTFSTDVKHKWSSTYNEWGENANGDPIKIEYTNTFLCNGTKNDNCFTYVPGTDDFSVSKLSNFTFKLPTNAIGDIKLKDVVKDGSTPQLTGIEIYKTGEAADKHFVAIISNNQFEITSARKSIPQSGKIKLTFQGSIDNKTGIGSGTVTIGTVNATITSGAEGFEYDYAGISSIDKSILLQPGIGYILKVSGFKNANNNYAIDVVQELKIEQPAYFSKLEYENTGKREEFLVGEKRTAALEYGDSHNGGTLTGLCYYWEVVNNPTMPTHEGLSWWAKKPDGTTAYPSDNTADNNDGSFDAPKPNVVYCNHNFVASDLSSLAASPSLDGIFGQWVRLVVRPESQNLVGDESDYKNGENNFGDPAFGKWKQVGVLLKPGYQAASETQTYNSITFKGCTTKSGNTSKKLMTDCYEDGYVVYSTDPINLSAMPINNPAENDYHSIIGWYALNNVLPNPGLVGGHPLDIVKTKFPSVTSEDESYYEITIRYSNVSTLTIKNNPSKGEYTITPFVNNVKPPMVNGLKVTAIDGTQKDIISSRVTDAKILNNALIVEFSSPVFITTPGIGIVKIGGTDLTTCAKYGSDVLNVENNVDDRLAHSISCSLGDNLNTSPYFNRSYIITISDFKNTEGEVMGISNYSFATGPGPSLDIPVLKTLASENLAEGEYAVSHPIEINIAGKRDKELHLNCQIPVVAIGIL